MNTLEPFGYFRPTIDGWEECGKDVTMHLVCLQMAGIDISAIPVLTPDDFKPKEVK